MRKSDQNFESNLKNLLQLNKALDLYGNEKIAFFGGSFNPPHIAHYYVVQRAMQAFDISYVVFLIAQQNQFKTKYIFDFEQRAQMMQYVIERCGADMKSFSDRMLVSRIEHSMHSTNTAQVLFYIKSQLDRICTAQQKKVDLYWLMGADNLEHFHLWQDFSYILSNYKVILFNRPGYDLYNNKYSWLLAYDNVFIINDTEFHISSSQIRSAFTAYLSSAK